MPRNHRCVEHPGIHRFRALASLAFSQPWNLWIAQRANGPEHAELKDTPKNILKDSNIKLS